MDQEKHKPVKANKWNRHVFPSSIPWRRHHGKSRLANASDLEEYLVILTTYQTISSEWSYSSDQQHSLLFSTRWRRIILDEGLQPTIPGDVEDANNDQLTSSEIMILVWPVPSVRWPQFRDGL